MRYPEESGLAEEQPVLVNHAQLWVAAALETLETAPESSSMDSAHSTASYAQAAPQLIVLAGVVGSGKSTLSEAWQRVSPVCPNAPRTAQLQPQGSSD